MTGSSLFRPPRWAAGPHAQTLLARWLRPARPPALVRERLELPDGDFVDLEWTAVGSDRPLVILLHGLEGSARSRYALETYRRLTALDVAVVGLHFRSCSGALNRLPRLYHSGDTGDLRHLVDTLRVRYPGRPLGAVGFSLGGNVLLKYLAEEGSGARIAAAAAVSVPYDLAAGAAHMERGLPRAYAGNLLRKLRRKVRAKAAQLGGRIDVAGALRARTFRAFDDAATAPLHGFAGADDYYRRASSGPRLGGVTVPTCLIHALDDPFLPPTAVPADTMRANPALEPVISDHGGHVGFLEFTAAGPRFWAERRVAAFLARALGAVGYRSAPNPEVRTPWP